jgi:HSP20 family protein
MSLALRTNSTKVSRDPYSLARELLGWDPFFGGRQASAFAPTFEVKETNEAFLIKADMPGVADTNLDINLHNGVLTIAGHRDAEDRKDGETYAIYERQYGSFTRSFALPDVADGDRIAAKLESGVLTLSIPKRAEAKPKKIALNK